jgi:hypothetical protein
MPVLGDYYKTYGAGSDNVEQSVCGALILLLFLFPATLSVLQRAGSYLLIIGTIGTEESRRRQKAVEEQHRISSVSSPCSQYTQIVTSHS